MYRRNHTPNRISFGALLVVVAVAVAPLSSGQWADVQAPLHESQRDAAPESGGAPVAADCQRYDTGRIPLNAEVIDDDDDDDVGFGIRGAVATRQRLADEFRTGRDTRPPARRGVLSLAPKTSPPIA